MKMRLKLKNYISAILILQFLIEINCNELHINTDNNSVFNSSVISHQFWIRNEEQRQCILENCDDSLFVNERTNSRRTLNIGVLLPEKKNIDNKLVLNAVLPVVELGVEHVKKSILKDFKINIHHRNTQCSSTYGPLAAVDLMTRKEAQVFLGPVCDYVLAPVARYCSVWNMSIITTGGLAAAFQWKATHFPTLTRIMGSYNQLGLVVKNIVRHFNWTFCAYLYHQNKEVKETGNSGCSMTLAAIHRTVSNTTLQKPFDETETSYEELKNILKEFKIKTRIIIMCANADTIRNVMLAADELKMVDSGEYVFFNIEIFGGMTNKHTPWYNESDTEERNRRARNAYTALMTVTVRQPEDEQYIRFSDQVKNLAKLKYNYTFEEKGQVSTFVTAFYDALLLFAYGLNSTIEEMGDDVLMQPLNSTRLATKMWGKSFQGITGNVTIDKNGDRLSDYSLLDMNPITGQFEIVANYLHNAVGLEFVDGKKIHWPGDRDHPPEDHPKCGFDNSLCPDDSSEAYKWVSGFLSICVLVLIIAVFLGYRHFKLEAEISSMTWKINPNDILLCNSTNQARNSFHTRMGSTTSIISEDLISLAGEQQCFITRGLYKGNHVAIKPIDTTGINLNRSLMLELKRMKALQNDHLARFYGAAIDGDPTCILTEYCPRGSLEDILEDDRIKLERMFQLSLMHDIVKGMHFLHNSEIHSHGSLKSSNCVVDSRFVLKITDFGLYKLRRNNVDQEKNFAYYKRKLWTAPELLRMKFPRPEGTQKGDVYSFGIIIHEIVNRRGVFFLGEDTFKEPKEIIDLVKGDLKYSSVPCRPKVDVDCLDNSDINSLMERCWAEEPNERPTFTELKQVIRKINKENESGNILDNLLQRMEQYADNLEYLVHERTKDYIEEKRKYEELLYKLLPKTIAEQLIEYRGVVAEMYDQVTIYFSDIVGFTSISAESTPMEVVGLLNDLYTCFDKIVGNFDVYKVETIGDAYMIVSGLPERNGNLHAREIARVALALLNAVKSFTIRHRPNEQLKLRIGLHSGSCCAGVVGEKMPRYCLFGDTVNTASRMESNGEPMKIHISQSTKQILDTFGNFEIEVRGLVSMKGKGEMLTFWLMGEKTTEEDDKSTELKTIPESESDHNLVYNTKNNLSNNILKNANNMKKNSTKKLIKHTNSLNEMNPQLKSSLISNDLINNNSNSNDIKNSQKNNKKQLSFGKKMALNNEPLTQPLISK